MQHTAQSVTPLWESRGGASGMPGLGNWTPRTHPGERCACGAGRYRSCGNKPPVSATGPCACCKRATRQKQGGGMTHRRERQAQGEDKRPQGRAGVNSGHHGLRFGYTAPACQRPLQPLSQGAQQHAPGLLDASQRTARSAAKGKVRFKRRGCGHRVPLGMQNRTDDKRQHPGPVLRLKLGARCAIPAAS